MKINNKQHITKKGIVKKNPPSWKDKWKKIADNNYEVVFDLININSPGSEIPLKRVSVINDYTGSTDKYDLNDASWSVVIASNNKESFESFMGKKAAMDYAMEYMKNNSKVKIIQNVLNEKEQKIDNVGKRNYSIDTKGGFIHKGADYFLGPDPRKHKDYKRLKGK